MIAATLGCEHCDTPLRIEWRFKPKPLGSYSLAGVQTKFAATRVPFALCDTCGLECEGKPW